MTVAPASRLYWRWEQQTDSDTLIVCFNGCAYRAQGSKTHLELFARVAQYGASTLWFAEGGEPGWYLEHDRRIQDLLRVAVAEPGLRRVLLTGASAGGYAAIRHAALLQHAAVALPAIHVAAVNPQTGFGPLLLHGLRGRLAAAGRRESELGSDPILPGAALLAAAAPSMLAGDDLAALLAAPARQRAIQRIDLHHDAANPIDRGFAEALAGLPGVHLQPQSLGRPHSQGCGPLMQSAAFVANVESALGRPPRPPRQPYLALLQTASDAAAWAAPRNFDIAFSLDPGTEAPAAAAPVFVHRQAGPRWPALAAALKAHWDQVRLYRQVWLPAAGVVVDVERVSTLFAVCEDLQLDLAQPALLAGTAGPAALRPHPAFQVRFTDRVGATAPVLSSTLLARVLPMLSSPAEPDDIALAWSLCVRPGKAAIVDATPLHCAGAALPLDDGPLTLAGLLHSGDTVCTGDGEALAARRAPGWLHAALNESLGHAGLHFG